MRRKTFDVLMTAVGAVFMVTLLMAGGLASWGSSFANGQVHDQLASQKIYFPPSAAFDHPAVGTSITPSMIPSVSQYAGQQLLTGEQAKVYANDFIAVHLNEIGGGLTYAQLSTKAMADPTNTALQAQAETVFKGTMLRGSLLTAYAFSVFGTIASMAAIGCYLLGGVMFVLTVLGLWHYRRVDDETVILR